MILESLVNAGLNVKNAWRFCILCDWDLDFVEDSIDWLKSLTSRLHLARFQDIFMEDDSRVDRVDAMTMDKRLF